MRRSYDSEADRRGSETTCLSLNRGNPVTALRGLIGKICFASLDDIVVFGNTIQEHNENLVMLFEILRATGLKLQPDKCEFLRPELEYLGHLIPENGVKPNPNKLFAVQNFKRPEKQKDLMSFLGLAGYYRKFIKNFSTIAKPLTGLIKKDSSFNWTPMRRKFSKTKRCSLLSTCLKISRLQTNVYTDHRRKQCGTGGNSIPRWPPSLLRI